MPITPEDIIIKAQTEKGTLCLNNLNAYGGSFKVPPLDFALKQMHGGTKHQRFFNKFPIYRMRREKPDVTEDIE